LTTASNIIIRRLTKMSGPTMSEDELLAKYELGTYLDGLRDSLEMTKSEIRKAIKIIEEGE